MTQQMKLKHPGHRSTAIPPRGAEEPVRLLLNNPSLFPFASFIGFTGTPVSQDDKDTRAVFSDYVFITI